ncbi:hypothetical protein [Zunongwangia endophytica]|uniref:Uncharacterized protein n=1 Tax=Zunongwangia endophytica TaxID=1808945 RepID=A0ABV8H581_9FLAO|nr:hypothetical protein [Zunongwangia endophytica]MDN3595308.1 hypothetical protein [Zunongwangia endophytica]
MIQNLCNIVQEDNFDTFHKATIIEASKLPKFNHLTKAQDVLTIINNLPEEFQAMIIRFMPERFNLSNKTKIQKGSRIYKTDFSLPLSPQDANIQSLLETYNNKEVVVLITRHSHSYLYGTSEQPLLFTYEELHNPAPSGLKGYTLSMNNESYGAALYFAGNEAEFPVVNRGLAFQLAGSL